MQLSLVWHCVVYCNNNSYGYPCFVGISDMHVTTQSDPDPFAIRRYVCRRDRWTIWMGGAGRSGDGLRMVSRVSVGGAGRSGDGLRIVSRISV